MLAALDDLAESATPCPVPGMPAAATRMAENFAGWHRLRAEPPAALDPWAARHLDDLCDLADRGIAALTGDTLVHLDIRADNLLIAPDGRVTIVDWPWACVGPAWLDSLMLLVNVRLHGGHDTTALLAERGGGPERIGVIVAFCGFLVLSWLRELSRAG